VAMYQVRTEDVDYVASAWTSPGFLVFSDSNEVRVRLFGDDALLGMAQKRNLTVVLLGRLTYRDELSSRHGVDAASIDAELVLAAYQAEGAVALERLEGDFSAVVVDLDAGKIEAVRDPMAGYPLYWMETRSGVAMATGIRLLPEADAFEA